MIVTKFFNHFNPDATRYPDLSPSYLTERCEASLGRMGIETIDVCLLHFYDQLTPLAEVAGTLEKLRDQGKIDRLETELEKLRERKTEFTETEYLRQLESILLPLAKLYEEAQTSSSGDVPKE